MSDDCFFRIMKEFDGIRPVKTAYVIRLSMSLSKYVQQVSSVHLDTAFTSTNDPVQWVDTVIEECNGILVGEFLENRVYYHNGYYYAVEGSVCRVLNKYRPPEDSTCESRLELVDSKSFRKVTDDMLTVAFYNDFYYHDQYCFAFDSFNGFSRQLMENPNLREHMRQYYMDKVPYAWFVESKMPLDLEKFIKAYRMEYLNHQSKMVTFLCEMDEPWKYKWVKVCLNHSCLTRSNDLQHVCKVLAESLPYKDAVFLSMSDDLPSEMIDALRKHCQDDFFCREPVN